MKEKKNIVFDLDGTIIDSGEGITRSVQYGLEQMGIIEEDLSNLTKFIGPPLYDSFIKYYNFTGDDLTAVVSHYRTYFESKGLHQNTLYPGMEALIKDLVAAGKKLTIATTKPEVYAVEIIEKMGLTPYFAFVGGSEKSGERTDKTQLIRYSMEHSGMDCIEHTVMIGDTRFDMIGAKELGMDSIGVFYGFGTREEIESNSPTDTVETTEELAKLLLP